MANRKRRIRLALIGCGQAAERGHLPALRHVSDAEVVGVADIDSDRLEQVANRFGVKRRYTDYSRLLDDPDVEAVAVCVPANLHVQVGLAVLEAGKHMLLEKPLALRLDECDRLIEQAERSSCIATIGFNMRWHRLMRKARDTIAAAALGQIRMIRTAYACRGHNVGDVSHWRKRRQDGGGALVDVAIHDFDLWRFLLASEVEEVFAMTRSQEADDEIAGVVARMANGALASSSFVERSGARYEVEVLGTEGRLQISCYCFDGLRFFLPSCRPGDIRVRLGGIGHTLKELPRALLMRGGLSDYARSFIGEWKHFIDCIRRGKPPECALIDGRRAQEIVLAAVESASLGQPIRVAAAPNELRPVSDNRRD